MKKENKEKKDKKEKSSKRSNENKVSKKMIIIIMIIFIFVVFSLLYKFLLIPQIHLKGGGSVVLNYKEKYVEKGYKATYFGKNISKNVIVSGRINSNKLGNYKKVYKVGKGFFTNTVIRRVSVKDIEKPKMNIDSKDFYVCPSSDLVPEKVEAKDNYDGDISKKVKNIISKDKKKITYLVSDKAGNTKKITKNVKYEDIEKPKMVLNDKDSVFIYVGDEYQDAGVKVEDNCDGDITGNVKVESNVNSNEIGEYQVNYSIKDKAGNEEKISRKVIVQEKTKNNTIYLTFDDGPNEGTTNIILDILKEEGVKATFFVTNKGPDELIKREFDEGHTVALHTASHDYATVYASVDSYFNDLYAVQERVKRITGTESKIIRFPGGSSNTISRKYSSGIMSALTTEVQNRGFKYYDWNLSSGDAAGGSPSSDTIYNNVVSNLRHDRVNMVLMHDIKTYTRDALRRIIQFGKSNGYRFEQITMATEMVTQRVNN